MAQAPTPEEIYRRAQEEGRRRLSMQPLMQASTAFIAGVTIVFGIAAFGVTRALVAPRFGTGPGDLAGALAFGIGLIFLVVGRTELFTENFFDPVAAAIQQPAASAWASLARLWTVVLALNLIGGAVMAAIFSVEGTLPSSAREALVAIADEIHSKGALATFTRAVAAGTLLTLLSYLLNAVDSSGSRIVVAYIVGSFLALGPFDHVVVSALHLVFGVWLANEIGYGDVASNIVVATAGNLAGGLVLVTLTHTVQVKASSRS